LHIRILSQSAVFARLQLQIYHRYRSTPHPSHYHVNDLRWWRAGTGRQEYLASILRYRTQITHGGCFFRVYHCPNTFRTFSRPTKDNVEHISGNTDLRHHLWASSRSFREIGVLSTRHNAIGNRTDDHQITFSLVLCQPDPYRFQRSFFDRWAIRVCSPVEPFEPQMTTFMNPSGITLLTQRIHSFPKCRMVPNFTDQYSFKDMLSL
jgi:hypothetical protein